MGESKYKYLGKNVILFAISTFAPKLLSILIIPLYTSKLSTADYGIVDLLTSTAGLLMPVFTLNIMESVLRFSLDKGDHRQIFTVGLKIIHIGSAVLGACLVVVSLQSAFGLSSGHFAFLFAYYYLNVIATLISNYLRGTDQVADMVLFSLVHSVGVLLLNLLMLTVLKWGVKGYIYSVLLSQFLAIAYVCLKKRLWRSVVKTGSNKRQLRKAMLKYSVPLIFNTLIWWINNASDRYMVTYFCGVAENGIYSVSYKIPNLLSSFNVVFASAWTLSAVKEFDEKDSDAFFSNGYATYNAGMIFLCGCLILMSEPLAKLLFANEFYEAWKFTGPLLVSYVFTAMCSFLGGVFAAKKDSKALVASTMLSAVVNIGLNLLLIPSLGAMGAAIATMVSYMVMWMHRLYGVRRVIALRVDFTKTIVGYLLLLMMVVWNLIGPQKYLVMGIQIAILGGLFRREWFDFWKKMFVRFLKKAINE